MANNRIYLECAGCGDVLYLGKHFCKEFYYESYDDISLEDKLNKFYEKHAYCEGNPLECFRIKYENNEAS